MGTRARAFAAMATPHAASPSDSADPSSGYAESERSMGDMEALMRAAIEAEDFENAAVYRDLLNTLKNSAAAAVHRRRQQRAAVVGNRVFLAAPRCASGNNSRANESARGRRLGIRDVRRESRVGRRRRDARRDQRLREA